MDTTQYGESAYLTPQIVKESQQPGDKKLGVIVSDVIVEEGKFGKQLSINVSFDQKIKAWKMDRESVKNMQKVSKHSENWLTKKVYFSVVLKNGKERVLGEPIME